jgi:hypothetical protein
MATPRKTLEHEMRDIFEKARKKNRELSITGGLLYSGSYFAQVIEGPISNLENLLKSIQADPRHKDMIILSNEAIANRRFTNWDMAFAGIEKEMRFDIAGIKGGVDEIELDQRAKNVISVLEQLVVHKDVLMGSKKIITDLIK